MQPINVPTISPKLLVQITRQDILANRPVATGINGFFFATDIGVLYYDSGVWNIVGPSRSPFDIRNYATGGNGTQANPWTGMDVNTPWQGFVCFAAPAGYYSFPNGSPAGWSVDGFCIAGDGWDQTYFMFGNAGPGFEIVNPVYGNKMRINVSGIQAIGNPLTTLIWHFRNTHRSIYQLLKATGSATTRSFLFEGMVGGNVQSISASPNDGGWISVPPTHIEFAQSGTNQPVTSMVVLDIHADNATTGVLVSSATFCHFHGASEQNVTNWSESVGGVNNVTGGNTYDTVDSEGGTGDGIVRGGYGGVVLAGQNTDRLRFPSGAYSNVIVGGIRNAIQIDSGALTTTIIGGSIDTSGTGGLTDNGSNSRWVGLRDANTGQDFADRVYGGSEKQGTDITLVNGNQTVTLPDGSYFRIIGPTAPFSIDKMTPHWPGRSVTFINTVGSSGTFNYNVGASVDSFYNAGGTSYNFGGVLSVVKVVYDGNYSRWVVEHPATGSAGGNVIGVGLEASRPAFGTPGNTYFPTDGYGPDVDTGSAWQTFSPLYPVDFPPLVASGVTTTLSGNGGSITAGATSMNVASSSGFPAVPFMIIIGTEEIKVTAVASLTWTIVRGYNGSTAATHTDGTTVTLENWEWVNQGATATVTQHNQGIYLDGGTSSATANLRVYKRLIPNTSSSTLTTGYLPLLNSASNASTVGLVLRESATAKLVTILTTLSSNIFVLAIDIWTNPTTFVSQPLGVNWVNQALCQSRVVMNGTSVDFWRANDKEHWQKYASFTKIAQLGFTAGPDEWGIYSDPESATANIAGINLVSFKES